MGLGDRIVPLRIAYEYGLEHREPVTLHLTGGMWQGRYAQEPGMPTRGEAFDRALGLLPEGRVTLVKHSFFTADQRQWLEWLRGRGFDAETWYLGDTLGLMPHEEAIGFDASPYMRRSPLLAPPFDVSYDIPDGEYVTLHPSGSVQANKVTEDQKAALIKRWKDRGYEVIVVGGEADDPLLASSLQHLALVQYHAAYHIGADSGPMHVASLYKHYHRLRLISPGRVSRNRAHWLANGVEEEPRP